MRPGLDDKPVMSPGASRGLDCRTPGGFRALLISADVAPSVLGRMGLTNAHDRREMTLRRMVDPALPPIHEPPRDGLRDVQRPNGVAAFEVGHGARHAQYL